MKNTLTPYELSSGEWVIICPPYFDQCGYDQFSNRTYPSHQACQKRIDALNAALPDLLMVSADLVEFWEDGDLAGAVRELGQILKKAWASG